MARSGAAALLCAWTLGCTNLDVVELIVPDNTKAAIVFTETSGGFDGQIYNASNAAPLFVVKPRIELDNASAVYVLTYENSLLELTLDEGELIRAEAGSPSRPLPIPSAVFLSKVVDGNVEAFGPTELPAELAALEIPAQRTCLPRFDPILQTLVAEGTGLRALTAAGADVQLVSQDGRVFLASNALVREGQRLPPELRFDGPLFLGKGYFAAVNGSTLLTGSNDGERLVVESSTVVEGWEDDETAWLRAFFAPDLTVERIGRSSATDKLYYNGAAWTRERTEPLPEGFALGSVGVTYAAGRWTIVYSSVWPEILAFEGGSFSANPRSLRLPDGVPGVTRAQESDITNSFYFASSDLKLLRVDLDRLTTDTIEVFDETSLSDRVVAMDRIGSRFWFVCADGKAGFVGGLGEVCAAQDIGLWPTNVVRLTGSGMAAIHSESSDLEYRVARITPDQ